MELEGIMPSEVSQTEKKKYHMVSLILKTKKQMYIYTENSLVVARGGE